MPSKDLKVVKFLTEVALTSFRHEEVIITPGDSLTTFKSFGSLLVENFNCTDYLCESLSTYLLLIRKISHLL